MKETTLKTVDSAGFKLRCIIEGEGFPVLVIGSALYYQRSFSPGIKKRFQFIFADHRGFVEPPSFELNNESFDLKVLIEDIELIRKSIGLEKMLIIGHSGHAFMALEYAKKYPERIVGVVMIAVTPNYSRHTHNIAANFFEQVASDERKEMYEQNMSKLAVAIAAAPQKRFVSYSLAVGPKSWYDYSYDASALWDGVYTNMQMIDYVWGEVFRDIDITTCLKQFNKPVLLALGKYDFLTGPALLWDESKHCFRDITINIFDKSAHSPQQEEADLFDQVLINWFNSVQTRMENSSYQKFNSC
jgi:proline iminopeptidase